MVDRSGLRVRILFFKLALFQGTILRVMVAVWVMGVPVGVVAVAVTVMG